MDASMSTPASLVELSAAQQPPQQQASNPADDAVATPQRLFPAGVGAECSSGDVVICIDDASLVSPPSAELGQPPSQPSSLLKAPLSLGRLALQRQISDSVGLQSMLYDDGSLSQCTTPGSLCPSPALDATDPSAAATRRSGAVLPVALGDVVISIADAVQRYSQRREQQHMDDAAMSSEGESEGVSTHAAYGHGHGRGQSSCDEHSLVRNGGFAGGLAPPLLSLGHPSVSRGVSCTPSLGGVLSDGCGSQSDREGTGSSAERDASQTGGPAMAMGKLRNLNPTSQRLRRNAKVNRQLMRFRRVKRHQQQQQHAAASGGDDLLYDADEPPMLRLASYCTCASFEFSELLEWAETTADLDGSLTLYSDVLHIKQKHSRSSVSSSTPPHAATRDIFLFEYGVVVLFNFTPDAEAAVLRRLQRFQLDALAKAECEDFDFCYGTEAAVSNDEIVLSSASSLEKLAVACALAQCIKLNVFEAGVEREVDANRHLSELLATTGSIPLSQLQISRTIGRLFLQRNNVNLHFDLLDSPECLWQQDRFKHVYDRLHAYLELPTRIDLLNKKMKVLHEMFDMLNDQMERKHANKLEWIIIWLIVFEVIIMLCWDILLKDILGFFHHGN